MLSYCYSCEMNISTVVRNSREVNFDRVRYVEVCIVIYRRVLGNGLLYYDLVSRTTKENYACVCDCDRKSKRHIFPGTDSSQS